MKNIRDRERLLKREANTDGGTTGDLAATKLSEANLRALGHENLKDRNKLKHITPPSLDELQREKKIAPDKVLNRLQLLEKTIAGPAGKFPGMLSTKESRENPPGTTGQYLAWHHKITKNNVLPNGDLVPITDPNTQQSMWEEWRDLRRIANKENEAWDPDVGNVGVLQRSIKTQMQGWEFSRQTFAPGARMTAAEWLEKFGDDDLSPVNRELLRAEAAAERNTLPAIEDSFSEEEEQEEEIVANCKAVTKITGRPCKRPAVTGGYCVQHGKMEE